MKFFQALPKKLKIFFHAVEMLLMLYVATALGVSQTKWGVHIDKYLPEIIISFVLIYPPVRLMAQFFKGVPGTSPDDVDPLAGFDPKPPKMFDYER